MWSFLFCSHICPSLSEVDFVFYIHLETSCGLNSQLIVIKSRYNLVAELGFATLLVVLDLIWGNEGINLFLKPPLQLQLVGCLSK